MFDELGTKLDGALAKHALTVGEFRRNLSRAELVPAGVAPAMVAGRIIAVKRQDPEADELFDRHDVRAAALARAIRLLHTDAGVAAQGL